MKRTSNAANDDPVRGLAAAGRIPAHLDADAWTSRREDLAVIQRVLDGERDAFRRLVEKYEGRVVHACRRVVRDDDEAEDLAQEAFIKAYRNLGRYDPQWSFVTWIVTIATRTALNAVRRRNGRYELSVEEMTGELATPAGRGPRGEAMRAQWMEHLRREVENLGEKMRTVFGLRYEDQLSISEIAEATGATETAVKVTLHRARKILRERLKRFADLV